MRDKRGIKDTKSKHPAKFNYRNRSYLIENWKTELKIKWLKSILNNIKIATKDLFLQTIAKKVGEGRTNYN